MSVNLAPGETGIARIVAAIRQLAFNAQGPALLIANNLSDAAAKYTAYDNISVHGADIASAATLNLEAATGNLVDVTGTTTITTITLSNGHERTVRFTDALLLTDGASLVLPGAANITTVAGAYATFRGYAAGVVRCTHYQRLDGKPVIGPAAADITDSGTAGRAILKSADYSFFQNYLSGLGIAVGASQFTVSAGVAMDSTNATAMKLASSLTKFLTAWAVGDAAGSLDTGSIGNNWYHLWLISRSDTCVVDVLLSLSATAPTMPTNYDRKRRIGSFKTAGSNTIISQIQDGDAFSWSVPLNDVAATNPGTAAVTRTLTVPTGIRVFAVGSVIGNGGTAADSPISCYLSDLSTTDVAANGSTGAAQAAVYNYSVGGFGGSTHGVFTNTSGQIRSRVQVSTANTILYINTTGWIDRRGRDG